MSATLEQIYTLNPTTIINDSDLFYLVRSPYSPGNDFGINGASLKSIFGAGGTVNPGNINELTYYAATGNTVSGLTTLTRSLLSSNSGGVPTWLALTNGQIVIGSTAGSPAAASLTAGSGINITPGSNSITISAINSGTVTSISAGTGITLTPNPITSTGSVALTVPVTEILGGTNQTTYTLGDILYSSASNTLSKLAGNITTTKQYLSQTGSGAVSAAPAWATISGSDITGAALTKTDDTNVTLTLGGTPTTALLRAASLTLGWTGQLSGSRGGTGVNNGANTITIGGNINIANSFTTSGNFSVTQTYTGSTNVTFPTSGTLATTSQLPTPSALTKTDDTNVTLTLGGTPATALLQATSLTLGWTGQLGLTRGGTNASLTADNGGIIYSTASALAILASTATAGKVLQSGSSAPPSWSTPTYPSSSGSAGKILRSDGTNNIYTTSTFADTYTANNLLYASAANTVTGLATANSSVLLTNGSGVPAWQTAIAAANLLPLGNSGVSFIGSTTFNTTSASGATTVVTGVGFQPTLVILIYAVVGTGLFGSVGFDNGTTASSVFNSGGVTASTWSANTSNSVVAQGSTGNNQVGHITALGSDGFTITWTKTGTPSGTLTIIFLCFK